MELIDKYLVSLEFTIQDTSYHSQAYKLLIGLSKVKEAIYAFEKAGLFTFFIEHLKRSAIFQVAEEQVRVLPTEANTLKDELFRLKEMAANLSHQIHKIAGDSSETSVYKISDFTDFAELSKAASTFQTIFSLTVLDPEIGVK
jgi:hypothetical protein